MLSCLFPLLFLVRNFYNLLRNAISLAIWYRYIHIFLYLPGQIDEVPFKLNNSSLAKGGNIQVASRKMAVTAESPKWAGKTTIFCNYGLSSRARF
jgi:hypothetical protein